MRTPENFVNGCQSKVWM
ncbi:hypothetical protein [secondary endosymbiont of Trabutina mannipara]